MIYSKKFSLDFRYYSDVNDRRFDDGREHAEPCPCLGIFGMSLATTERDLFNIFKEFGWIEKVGSLKGYLEP